MDHVSSLQARLEAIAASLAGSGHGLALIGLGSAGLEGSRLDRYSDLDFFAIVEEGHKQAYLDDLGWLARVRTLAYAFRNTADGYKLLFADGIFCEMAVFTPAELAQVPFAPGRIVWQAAGMPPALATPALPARPAQDRTAEWLVGEAATNLYVGMCRFRRGEKLSALRLVQGHAVERVLELAALIEAEQPGGRDPFDPARRFEQRFPQTAQRLAALLPGYAATPAAAQALLGFLTAHFPVNPALERAILALCDDFTQKGDYDVCW